MKRVKMRTRAVIWTPSTVMSASGEQSQSLVEFGRFWCAVRVRAMSNIEDGQIETTVARHDITFRYSAKLAALPQNAQIEIDGRMLHVTGIDFGDYNKKYIRVTATESR